jgi:uncharacterized membrane protein
MHHIILIIGVIIFVFPQISIACAVCYGDPQAPMTAGLNQAIFFLLGVIGFILSIILIAGIYFYKRSKSLNKSRANVW